MEPLTSVTVKHDWAMAHRLTSDESPKCQQIHGHNWICFLTVSGPPEASGMVLEFGWLKAELRGFLDGTWDHKTMLNEEDPLASAMDDATFNTTGVPFPGAFFVPFEPTTENIAHAIHNKMSRVLPPNLNVHVEVWETERNCASYGTK